MWWISFRERKILIDTITEQLLQVQFIVFKNMALT